MISKHIYLNKITKKNIFLFIFPFLFSAYGLSSSGFEAGFGSWTQSLEDDFNWSIGPPLWPHSSGTGPLSAANGSHYAFIESSSPNNPYKSAIINNSLNLSSLENQLLTFKYNMYGEHIGELYFEVLNGEWVPLAAFIDQQTQQNEWKTGIVDLSSFSGIDNLQIRFRAVTGNGPKGDIAIDSVSLIQSNDSDADGMSDLFEQIIIDDSSIDNISSISDVLPYDDYDQDSLNNLTEFLLSKSPVSSIDGNVDVQDGITILSRIIENLDNINQLGTDYQGSIVNKYDPLEEIASSIFASIYEKDMSFSSLESTPSALDNFESAEALFFHAMCSIYSILDYDINSLSELLFTYGDGLLYDKNLYHKDFDANAYQNQVYDFVNNSSLSDKILNCAYSNAIPEISSSIKMLEWAGYNLDYFSSNVVLSASIFPLDTSVNIDKADTAFLQGMLGILKSLLHHLSGLKIEADINQLVVPSPTSIRTITVDGDESDWNDISPSLVGLSEIALSTVQSDASNEKLSYAKYAVDETNLYFLVKANTSSPYIGFYHKGSNINGLTNIYISAEVRVNDNTGEKSWNANFSYNAGDFGSPSNSLPINVISNGIMYEGNIELNAIAESFVNTNLTLAYIWHQTEEIDNYGFTYNNDYTYSNIADIFAGNIFGWASEEWILEGEERLVSHPDDYLLSGHTILRDFVTNELALAKSSLIDALDSILMGYNVASSRPYTSEMHLIEINPADFSEGSDGEELISQVERLTSTLNAPYLVSYENGFDIEITDNFIGSEYYDGSGYLSERVYLGALYEPGYLTLDSLLPQFYKTIYDPLIDTLPPPTIGGLFPDMTQERLNTILQLGIKDGDISVDIDEDGMPDSFEINNFNHPSAAMPHIDYDDDGISSINEYRFGTHPLNEFSTHSIRVRNNYTNIDGLIVTNGPILEAGVPNQLAYDLEWCASIGESPIYVGSGITSGPTPTPPYDFGYYRLCFKANHSNDIDGDGILNEIEESIGGNYWSTLQEHLFLDSDFDGKNNLSEALYKTNPFDSNSFFKAEIEPQANQITFGWGGEFYNPLEPIEILVNKFDPDIASFSNIWSSATNTTDVFQIDLSEDFSLYQIATPKEDPYLFKTDWMPMLESAPEMGN